MASDPYRLSLDRYIAELNHQYQMGVLQLNRDEFEQIKKPTYQNVTLPGAVSGLTGVLMDRPDLYGGNAGRLTWDSLQGLTDARGIFLDDPRVPPELRGKNSLARDRVEIEALTQQWRERTDQRDFGAARSDADRAFAEAQRARFAEEQREDAAKAIEWGLQPGEVVGGLPLPDYLRPHAEWVRQYRAANNNAMPGYADLVRTLAESGRVPEDYNGGRPYAGQVPAAGPGILWDARRGYVDTVTGNTMDARTAGATIQTRQGQASRMTVGPDGQPVYQLRPGIGAQGLGASPGGVIEDGGLPTGGGVRPVADGGERAYATSAMNRALPAYTGPGAPTAGGGAFGAATAAIGSGQPMSLEQRRLIEQGRQADQSAALTQNDQRIREKQVEYQNAIAAGNLALAERTQTELTDLNNRKLALEQQSRAFDEAFRAGELTGNYNGYDTLAKQRLNMEEGQAVGMVNGQETLARGALMGTFNGMSTLAGQTAYGGSALVGQGLTLEAQQALGRVGGQATVGREQMENQAALGYLNLLAGQRGPADYGQYLKTLGGTPQGLRDLVDASAGRYTMARYGDYGGQAQAASLGSLVGDATGGAARQQAEFAAAQRRLVAPNQISAQNYAKMGTTQRQLLGSLYEGQGYRPEDVEETMRRSLPRYSGPRSGVYR